MPQYLLAVLLSAFALSPLTRAQAQTTVLFDEDDPIGAGYRDASQGAVAGGDALYMLAGDKLPVTTNAFTGTTAGDLEYLHTSAGSWSMFVGNDGGAVVDLTEADSIVLYLNGPVAVPGGELPRFALRTQTGQTTEPIWLSVPSNVRRASSSGFTDQSTTNASLTTAYVEVLPSTLRRPGYPEDLIITFDDVPLDTSVAGIGAPATPSKFVVETASGLQLDFRFRDLDGNGTISASNEYIDVLTPNEAGSSSQSPTWRLELASVPADLVPPGAGDVFELNLLYDEFSVDGDPGTWQRRSYPMIDVAPDGAPTDVSGIVFMNGGVTPEQRSVWFDRVEAVTNDDETFLDDVQKKTFAFFWNETNPANGLVRDRTGNPGLCSIAAVGFGLSAYTVGIDRGWITREQGIQRVLNTLRFFWNAPQGSGATNVTGYKGFFYHFLDMDTGYRRGTTELSTIDTALLLGGVIHVGEYFDGESAAEEEIRALADSIYFRVDWQWAVNNDPLVTLSWDPEDGYSNFDWRGYNEAMIIYILGIGSPTYPLDPASWTQWTSTYRWESHYGFSFVRFPPLFGHQYTHVWVDFRGIQDDYMRGRGIDYFENSRRATLAQRAYHIDNPRNWVNYSRDEWGLTASDYPDGYIARGAPPAQNDEGTIAPTAPGGSVPFAPTETIAALRTIKRKYQNMYGAYGFRDAYNRTRAWYSDQYLGIDQGPIILMIENHRTGAVWDSFMQNEHVQRGLDLAGFRPTDTAIDHGPRASGDDATPDIVAAYPNPFSEGVTIRVELPEAVSARLEAFDVLGRRVAVIADRHFSAGHHDVLWSPAAAAKGVYFIRVSTQDAASSVTVVLGR